MAPFQYKGFRSSDKGDGVPGGGGGGGGWHAEHAERIIERKQ